MSFPTLITFIPHVQKLAEASFQFIPFALQKQVLEKTLGELFSEAIEDEDLDFLIDRAITIRIDHTVLHWQLGFDGMRFIVEKPNGKASACISGELSEFILLASRKEDPDTLFFQRRLSIEGNTELSLAVKNLLDTLDLSQLPAPLRFALDRMGSLQQSLCQQSTTDKVTA